MKPNFVQEVSNWGGFPTVRKELRIADDITTIRQFIFEKPEIIARGNGRCYGDASLGEFIFSTKRLNKFISFDRLNGILECDIPIINTRYTYNCDRDFTYILVWTFARFGESLLLLSFARFGEGLLLLFFAPFWVSLLLLFGALF